MESSSPASRTKCAKTPAAVGERQMFPVQTNRTFRKKSPGSFGRERDTEHTLFQLGELVTHARGLLELQVARVLQHLLLERLDLARDLLLAHRLVARLGLRGGVAVAGVVRAVDAVDQVLDALDHADRRDAVLFVVGAL